MRVLIVEDDKLVADGLKEGLRQLNYTVDVAHSAESAERFVLAEDFDVALVDIGLPEADGLQFIRRIRAQGKCLPVLILTALDSVDDTIRGLDSGADDYLTKPYRLPEVAARIRALVRRSKSIADACLRHGPLSMDTASRKASLDEKPLELTNREWAILEMLVLNAPNVVSKDKLTHNLAGWDKDITPNAIEVHVSRVRNKLSVSNLLIRTVRGIGYRIESVEP